MIAAVRWAKAAGAARTVVAVPVAATDSLERVRREADKVVCPYPQTVLVAVGARYVSFGQVDEAEVIRLMRASRSR
jgi:putative phosphoribosyl transferase